MRLWGASLCGLLFIAGSAQAADAPDKASDESWAVHAQTTFLDQYHPAFHSDFSGPYSMDPGSRGNETFDATLFAGARLWQGGEVWVNGEVDQGFGLSGTLGAAAFPSAEAYKVGAESPYFRLQRLFFRQTFDLGGEAENIDADANQLGGSRSKDNLVITAGKISVVDIFDTNTYAHDPKSDFMNWAIVDAGAFDYAADAWGYSYGVAAEWTQDNWTLRGGLFDLSRVPNTTELERGFGQYEIDAEGEWRFALFGHDGKLKLLGFLNRGRMGSYNDAVALAAATHSIADTSLVRHPNDRAGVSLNWEQGVTDDLGAFLRASANDGSQETYEFTDIHRSVSAGLSLKGESWGRADDTIGLAVESADISKAAQNYFAAGGLGLLIGDGALPHYGNETVVETYYNATLIKGLAIAADYQLIANPAYNPDRGPISVLGARLHAAF